MTPLEHKNEAAVKINEVLERIRDVANSSGNNTQTVIHRSEGPGLLMGVILGVAITTCVATWVALVLFDGALRDLTAWKDLHNNEITALQNTVKGLEKKP